MKVLVCDDDGRRAQSWREDIEYVLNEFDSGKGAGEAEVTCLEPSDLAAALNGLTQRQRAARGPDASTVKDAATLQLSQFDSADVLVLDHDLTPAEPDPLTDSLQGRSGEGLALLARCFSTTGLIVLVNKGVQSSTFDLTMTRFSDSYADLNVTQQDLSRSALWHGLADARPFRPSHWPVLSSGGKHLAEIADGLALDDVVLESLGLSEALTTFEREQLDILGDEPETATFWTVAKRPGVGLGLKDEQPDEAILRRIAVHGIARWLAGTVLPAQNVLVDAAHLLERVPGLRAGGIDIADATPADFHDVDALVRFAPGLERLRGRVSPSSEWLGRPVWLWADLDPETFADEATDETDLVVCEDTTTLLALDKAKEFEAAVSGPYLQRFVRHLKDGTDPIAYMPRNRLLR